MSQSQKTLGSDTTETDAIPGPTRPEDVHFPRIGDRDNEIRQGLIDGLGPEPGSVGSLTTSRIPPWKVIAGFPPLYFGAFFAIALLAAYTGNLPESMLSGFAVTMLLGGVLIWIGNFFPYVREMGLPTILCTFVPAILVYVGLFPENVVTVTQTFVDGTGFLDFFVAAIIVGSVLSMPRALLIQAGPRFIVPLIGCLIATFTLVGLLGALFGFGMIEAMLFIAAPVMAGGLGVGAVPTSEMYADKMGGSAGDFMGDLMSAVVVANIVCILVAGLYNALGKLKKQPFEGFNGYGQLLRIKKKGRDLSVPKKKESAALSALGKGLVITAVLFVLGQFLGGTFPWLHTYAWVIIAALAIKIFKLFPEELEDAATSWGDMIQSFLVPALLVGVSLTYISIEEVLLSLSNPSFIPLIVITVLISALSSGLLGWLVKMNFIEASITPGLVMADTGGSGDVAVLSAAQRMHLMPFAALTTRFGGVLVLFGTSLLTTFL
ncbi:2-hydroxycarboxylate transporter family protein [Corynebacterium halotolerans]|uniref:Putative 2-hydroxycarboxylate transporter n=1 Tax=Corynebacterium halotolerans YIM 70093 = DSM 44683 TaxID=1121362 RepID=M1NJU2_9CORY|nr:2-hydroxycarboxylate transporter family protein [Corynebacterium halotolerans]AGF71668.1 putative 2-hydroxycarboxylate transporter [Corynebacterium halotolerans YIM 70093 = DSM 44683]